MRRIVVLALALLLLFGCAQPPPEEQAANIVNKSGNVTAPQNITEPEPPKNVTPQNKTEPPKPQNKTQLIVTPGMKYLNGSGDFFEVYFLYVGRLIPRTSQGDAIFMRKGDMDILVDGGPAASTGTLVDFLRDRKVDDIDLLISTNSDMRNAGAIPGLLGNFTVEEFWYSGMDNGNDAYGDVVQAVRDRGIYYRTVGRGERLEANGIHLALLNPPRGAAFGDEANDSIVMRVGYGKNFTMLLTSGIQDKAELDLLTGDQRPLITNVTYLQAPYYGLPPATGRNIKHFLQVTNPKRVIITGCIDDSPAQGGSRDSFRHLLAWNMSIPYTEIYNGSSVKLWTNGYDIWNGTWAMPVPED